MNNRHFKRGDTFELTSDHIKLIQNMYVGWNDCETGAPEICPKRPYGNSYVPPDIFEILGWEVPDEDEDEEAHEEAANDALAIHYETSTALQIILLCKTFEPGTFIYTEDYDARSWKRR